MFKVVMAQAGRIGCVLTASLLVSLSAGPTAAQQRSVATAPNGAWTNYSRDPKFAHCQKQANAQRIHFEARRAFIRSCFQK
jgi:hypothetical protein